MVLVVDKIDLSIIIPVFRGRTILNSLIVKIGQVLEGHYSYEILLICDKCDPVTAEVAKNLNNTKRNVKTYMLQKNYGQHKALLFGFPKCSGEFVITMDEDLQHDPGEIPKLIAKQKEGDYDVVYGSYKNSARNMIRKTVSFLARRILKFLIPYLYEKYSPYRLIRSDIAVKASLKKGSYIFVDDFLSQVTNNIAHSDISLNERPEGHSSYSVFRIIKHSLLIILSYSGINTFLFILGTIIILPGVFFENSTMLITGSIFSVLAFVCSVIIYIHRLKSSKPVLIES